MSANVSIRSLGRPYFWCRQQHAATQSDYGNAGPIFVEVHFRVFQLPPVHSSSDEKHAFFSFYAELGNLRIPLLEIGCTPSGKVYVDSAAGIAWMSSVPKLSADGLWHVLKFQNDTGANATELFIDDFTDSAYVGSLDGLVGASGDLTFALPMALALFNGTAALARTDLAIRYFDVAFSKGPTSPDATWNLRTPRLPTIPPDVVEPGLETIDFTLTPEIGSFAIAPYGAAGAFMVADGYRWQVDTAYTRRTPPQTQYTRMAAL